MLETAIINDGWDEAINWQKLADDAVQAAFAHSVYGALVELDAIIEIAIRLADDDAVQNLNASYRNKDQPTNVLSFPLVPKDLLSSLANTDDGEILLGDIILARETCEREAKEKSVTMTNHASHLLVHGVLHLLGYDHETENDALVMEELEVKALNNLGINNPYSDQING